MLKDLLLHIRYPYTAGIIAVIWLGTAALVTLGKPAPVAQMIIFDIAATTLIAAIGFSSPRK
jgi:hypothetical protein